MTFNKLFIALFLLLPTAIFSMDAPAPGKKAGEPSIGFMIACQLAQQEIHRRVKSAKNTADAILQVKELLKLSTPINDDLACDYEFTDTLIDEIAKIKVVDQNDLAKFARLVNSGDYLYVLADYQKNFPKYAIAAALETPASFAWFFRNKSRSNINHYCFLYNILDTFQRSLYLTKSPFLKTKDLFSLESGVFKQDYIEKYYTMK